MNLFPCLCERGHNRLVKTTARQFVRDAASRSTVNVLDKSTHHDPTGTHALRTRFRADLDKRWERVRRLVIQALGATDTAFGLEPSVVSVHASLSSGNRVKAFGDWLNEALRQIVYGYTGTWTEPYIAQAIAMAKVRARRLTGTPTTDAAALPDRELALLQLTASELDGICAAASQHATRVMTHGLLANIKPKPLARAVAQRLTKIGKDRSRMLANAMVVKAFSSATLNVFRKANVTQVGTVAERNKIKVAKGPHGKHIVQDRRRAESELGTITVASPVGPLVLPASAVFEAPEEQESEARLRESIGEGGVEVVTQNDDLVCLICEDISDSGPYDLDEAESLIPAHPNCRCAFVPVEDERFADVHEDE